MKVKVNDVDLELAPGTSAIDAVFQAGHEVPYFCSHEYMSPIGACRMCLAKVGAPRKDRATGEWILDEETGEPQIFWFPNPMATCTTSVMEGMVIDTLCDEAKKAQGGMMEMHLINHPLDCPTCDKGGACELQDQAYEYGAGTSRFVFDKRHQEKHHDLSDLVTLDRERCIHCKRCVRYFEEVPGDEVLDFIERGGHTYIGNIEEGLPSNFSGNITDICPVGALLDTTSRFRGRNWEYDHTRTVSMNDASGAAITVDSRTGRIERIKAAHNSQVNKVWIDDGTRFGYEYVNSENRIKTPLVRKGGRLEPVSWEEAATAILAGVEKLEPSEIAIILRADSTLEEAVAAKSLSAALGTEGPEGKAALLEHYPRPAASLIPTTDVATFTDVAISDALFVVADPTEELPILDLRIKDALKGIAPVEMMEHGIPIADLRLTERMKRKKEILTVAAPYQVDLMQHAGRTLNFEATKEVEFVDNLPAELISELEAAENAVIVVGAVVLANPAATKKLYALAEKVSAKVMAIGSMANSYGLEAMQLSTAEYSDIVTGQAKAVIVSGLNPAQNSAAFTQGQFVVAHSSFHNETTEMAQVVLPASTGYEKEGTVRNAEGRYLSVNPAPVDAGESGDFTFVAKYVGEALGTRLEGRSIRSARRQFVADYSIDLSNIPEEGLLAAMKDTGIELSDATFDASGNVLLVPSMVRADFAAENHHLSQSFGYAPLVMTAENADRQGLNAGDKVRLSVAGHSRLAEVKLSERISGNMMLLPTLADQITGLANVESLSVERVALDTAVSSFDTDTSPAGAL